MVLIGAAASTTIPYTPWLAPAITGALALVLAIVAFVIRRVVNRTPEPDPLLPLDKKIELVAFTSAQLSRLNEEIKVEFELQKIEVERLQADAAEAKNIAALNEAEREAVMTAVRGQMQAVARQGKWPERGFQIALSAVFFALGIAATLIIQAVSGAH